jgi:riboflavin kinase/FMN adenylyltransferase
VVGSLRFCGYNHEMQQSENPKNSSDSPDHNGGVLTLGNFDGFHRGHQAIVARVVDLARQHNIPAIVLTLFPHPGNVLHSPGTVPLLMPLEDRIKRLEDAGIDHVEVISFTPALAELSATDFAQEYMIKPFRPRWMVAGPDTRFGHNRHGDAELLAELGRFHGFEVLCEHALVENDEKISSSTLRSLVARGDVALARKWLGRPYSIRGEVVEGDGRGRTIGIPTANVLIVDHVEPATGVYAVEVKVGAKQHIGVANYGRRPTFVDIDNAATVLEIHLLDPPGIDLYGCEVEVSFIEYLRREQRFDGADALVAQIKVDIENARAVLRGHAT